MNNKYYIESQQQRVRELGKYFLNLSEIRDHGMMVFTQLAGRHQEGSRGSTMIQQTETSCPLLTPPRTPAHC